MYLLGAIFVLTISAGLQASEVSSNDIVMNSERPFEDCLKKDSISCVQVQIYRSLKSFFDRESLSFTDSISFVKDQDKLQAKARSNNDILSEEQILEAKDVEQRESALESFAFQKVTSFFQERSLRWNISPLFSQVTATARSFVEDIPEEARRRRKVLKQLLPILIGVKLKAIAFIVMAYFGIALIAKKSILVSLISLAISGFALLKKMMGQQKSHHPHHEVHETYISPHSGGYGGSVIGGYGYDSSGYGHGEYGSHSSPVAHTLAYGGQKSAHK